jgi:hypothetical protein
LNHEKAINEMINIRMSNGIAEHQTEQAIKGHSFRTSLLHVVAVYFLFLQIGLAVVVVCLPDVLHHSLRVYFVSVLGGPSTLLAILLLLPSVRSRPQLVQYLTAFAFAVSFFGFGVAADSVITRFASYLHGI